MRALLENIDGIIEKLKEDWDYTLIITGTKRKGKSNLGYKLAKYITRALGSKFWICYSYGLYLDDDEEKENIEERRKLLGLEGTNIYPASMKYALTHAGKHDVILADESINFLANAEWNTPEARDFIKRHDSYGYKNLTMILIMPSFKGFVKGFREDRVKAHLWIKSRGRVHIYPARESRLGVFFPSRPAFKDTFPDFTKEDKKIYSRIKEYMLTIEDTDQLSIRDYMKMVCRRLYRKGITTQKERSEILGVGRTTVQRWDNEVNI